VFEDDDDDDDDDDDSDDVNDAFVRTSKRLEDALFLLLLFLDAMVVVVVKARHDDVSDGEGAKSRRWGATQLLDTIIIIIRVCVCVFVCVFVSHKKKRNTSLLLWTKR
jgi:hypothetical protein